MDPSEITLLLQRIDSGDESAAEKLLPIVYRDLRRLAAARLSREPPGQTLQATALVHEGWLRLGADCQPQWQNQAQFFAGAAQAMRRILVDRARRRLSQKGWRSRADRHRCARINCGAAPEDGVPHHERKNFELGFMGSRPGVGPFLSPIRPSRPTLLRFAQE